MKSIHEYDTWARNNNKGLIVRSGLYRGITPGYQKNSVIWLVCGSERIIIEVNESK